MMELSRAAKAIQATKGLCMLFCTVQTEDLKQQVTMKPLPGVEDGLLNALQGIWLEMLDSAAAEDGYHRDCAVYRRDGSIEVHYQAFVGVIEISEETSE